MSWRRTAPVSHVLGGTERLESEGDLVIAQWSELIAWYDQRLAKAKPTASTADDLLRHVGALQPERLPVRTVTLGARAGATTVIVATTDPEAPDTQTWIGHALQAGGKVVVPALVRRERGSRLARRLAKDHRHILHRLAFPLGLSLVGLEGAAIAGLAAAELRSGRNVLVVGVDDGARAARIGGLLLPRDQRASIVVGSESVPGPLDGGPIDRLIQGQAWLGPPSDWPIGEVELEAMPRGEIGGWLADRLGVPGGGAVDAETWIRLRRAASATFRTWLARLKAETQAADLGRAEAAGLVATPRQRRAAVSGDLRAALQRSVEGEAVVEVRAARPARTRLIRITAGFAAYELILDTGAGLTIWAHILVPREARRPRPAVIAQHGLGGRPGDVTGIEPSPTSGPDAYHAFGARLADRGYVVVAPYLTVPEPQANLVNPLVVRAVSLGEQRSRAELIKLRAVVDWLQTQSIVERDRIGYYGLSYGGHAALWVAGLEPRIRAVVVSGHANDWIAKTTDLDDPRSFMAHPDEDFTVRSGTRLFGHLELIAAAWPRPTLIEAGSDDPITSPAWSARITDDLGRWAKAWGQSDRLEVERFEGAHEVAGARSFEFLERWLWPSRRFGRDYEYRLPQGHDLPGIGDISDDFVPFLTGRVASGEELEVVVPISRRTTFRGVGLRLSATGELGDLTEVVVAYADCRGRPLGTAVLHGDRIHPLWDLWHDAPIEPRRVDGNVTATICPRGGPGSGVVVYGPRSLAPRDRRLWPAVRSLPARTVPEPTHEFARAVLDGSAGDEPPPGAASNRRRLSIRAPAGGSVAARWVREALQPLAADAGLGPDLEVTFGLDPTMAGGPRSHRLDINQATVRLTGRSEVGWLAAAITLRDRLATDRELRAGSVTRVERVTDRVTTGVMPAGTRYREADLPTTWTDGALMRVAKAGFTGIWTWANLEDVTDASSALPELADPEAGRRVARLERLAARAGTFGLDCWVYLAIGYRSPPSAAFWAAHPDLRGGDGWIGPTLCTSNPVVLRHQGEVVESLVAKAPSIAGLLVIFDIEGFYFCGSEEAARRACPRCRTRPSETLAAEVLTNLDRAVRSNGEHRRLIAWSYGWSPDWVGRMLPSLPPSVEFQADFSKGVPVRRGGIEAPAGDDTISEIGPSPVFEHLREAADGRPFWAKGEHAISLDAIFVPFLPAMDQFAARAAAMRASGAVGWLSNWIHYGFLDPLPARLFNRFGFDPLPGDELLDELAGARYGQAAVNAARHSWTAFTAAMRTFPFSDPIARAPGPIQKGPTQPLWLTPGAHGSGRWRSWQNDLAWTEPFGPEVARASLAEMLRHQRRGIRALQRARSICRGSDRERLEADLGVAQTWAAAIETMVALIEWIVAREGENLSRMRAIASRQLRLVRRIRPVLERDSRLGFAQDGGGVIRGGLFTPALLRDTEGHLDDLVNRVLAVDRTDDSSDTSTAARHADLV